MDGGEPQPRPDRLATELGAALGGSERIAERDFIAQVAQDVRDEDLPELSTADLVGALAGFWRSAEHRPTSDPIVTLSLLSASGPGEPGLEMLTVLQDDAPFLVDSIMGELTEQSLDVRGMTHPVVWVARDAEGRRLEEGRTREESMIAVLLGPVGEDRREALLAGVRRTLTDVRAAVSDFAAMTELMKRTARELAISRAPSEPYGMGEYQEFLRWLAAERFVFLGARIYDYPRTPDGDYAHEEPTFKPGDSLGVLRDPTLYVLRRQSEPAMLASQLTAYLDHAAPLVVAKSNLRSRVHRRAYMDYVGIKRYGADGRAYGEVRFVGLFASEAYETAAHDTPLVRKKLDHVFERAIENPSAHTKNRLRRIVETYPRDELFQIDDAELLTTAMGILHLYDRPRVRLFARTDPFDRFVSVLLFFPRERYDSEARERVGRILAAAFGGRISAYYPNFSEQMLVRVHFIIGVAPGEHKHPDLVALEAEIAEAVRTWSDRFESLIRRGGVPPDRVGPVLARYGQAFPVTYRESFGAEEALADLEAIETLGEAAIGVRAHRFAGDQATSFRFKLYHRDAAVPLAQVMPVLDDMGLRALYETGYPVKPRGGAAETVWIHEFVLDDPGGEKLVFAEVKRPFEEAFAAIWRGEAESDGFNRLVLELGIGWREAALIRTLARYRQQSGLDPSQAVQEAALRDFPEIARLILEMFKAKFDPAARGDLKARADRAQALFIEIETALQSVASLDADRVLRRLALLTRALVRTNFYQTGEDGGPKPRISVKIASNELEALPAPKPFREIYVSAPSVEGVHLRFGPVARGGLRWSDRRDDFRTEVLGLVKAQQVKNAVIVPVGSKGGFYPKLLPRAVKGEAPSAEATRGEGVRAYKTFLCGLLDITDNLDASGAVVRPADVIAHDGDDPYLVVAADKGTATFSDIANGVAADYGFWLGDAFASGGSAGYDHKAMGITARGAWEAVKRHFREMGRDIQAEPFTCIGVGDMSGDVFGNGALLSHQIKLVAAFDHRHVFIDPEPDPETSWAERKRLFDLPRSSWADYDPSLISPGGGVFPRTAKTVPLSPEIRALLGIEEAELPIADLVRAVLRAPAELLYLGGIGTYVKAPGESQGEVGDKANDAVRVDATELRVKVVGEGANLGVTQAARIAFAKLGNAGAGGRINTDAIDNSAGVDTSDHEVNIKILLSAAEKAGALTAADRDPLLASMTDEVAAHVLAHNYAQTLGLSLQEANAPAELDAQERFMSELEAAGRLDRRVEGLPRTAQIGELRAAGRGLTRPELAVLTAYGKLELSAEIVAGAAPDDPWFERTLVGYFPTALARFEAQMKGHRLRREIIATVLANVMVDIAGPTFAGRLRSATGVDADGLVTAFEAARQVFRLDEAWSAVNGLDGRIEAAAQTALYQEIAGGVRAQAYWLAQRLVREPSGVQALIDRYRTSVDALVQEGVGVLSTLECEAADARQARFVEAGAPESLARSIALLRPLTAATEIADLAQAAGRPAPAAARIYHQVGAVLGLDRLRAAAADIRGGDAYERSALRGLIIDMLAEQIAATRRVLQAAGDAQAGATKESARAAVEAWVSPRGEALNRGRRTVEEIEQAGGGWSFAKLTLANAALKAAA